MEERKRLKVMVEMKGLKSMCRVRKCSEVVL